MSTLSQEKQPRFMPVYFRLAPEYRRCGIYLLIGYLIFVGTSIVLHQLSLARDAVQVFVVPFVLAIPMLGTALLIGCYLLRVDDQGIWRRHFFRWDLWPWQAFATGQIRQGVGKDSYVFPSKPWWNRVMFFDFLREDEREHLAELVRRAWTPPPPPVLPAELTIKFGLPRRWVRLSEKGIQVGKGKQDSGRSYPWTAVIRVRITRLDHARRDLRQAELILPEGARPILLVIQKGRPLWTGAEPQVLAAFLERAFPRDRLLVTAMTGPPRSVAEADWRLLDVDRIDRETKQLAWITVPGLLAAIGCLLLLFLWRENQPNRPAWDLARFVGTAFMCCWIGFVAAFVGHVLLTRIKQANAMRLN